MKDTRKRCSSCVNATALAGKCFPMELLPCTASSSTACMKVQVVRMKTSRVAGRLWGKCLVYVSEGVIRHARYFLDAALPGCSRLLLLLFGVVHASVEDMTVPFKTVLLSAKLILRILH